jgi:geranylgeranyl diphosphate synthase type II
VRPSAVREFGLDGAVARFRELMDAAIESIPPCPGAQQLAGLIQLEAKRLVPREIVRHAA